MTWEVSPSPLRRLHHTLPPPHQRLSSNWLIATAIELKSEKAPVRVAIVTADFGLEVKAGAHVEVIEMPETMRLPEELNAEEKRVKQLERELRSIQSTSPTLAVSFEDGEPFQVLSFFQIPAMTTTRRAELLDAALQKYPKKESPQPGLSPAAKFQIDFSQITTPFIERRNSECDRYFAEYEEYLDQVSSLAEWFNKTAKVSLRLRNTGGSPATGIDVQIHFPDGFEVLDEEALPNKPSEPVPPLKPEDAIKSMLRAPLIDVSQLSTSRLRMPRVDNVRLLGIKKTNSHDVRFRIERLKHHTIETLPSVYLHFPNTPESFQAEYRILADNVAQPVTGDLHFIYKPDGSPETP
jgi:hypothetical protein